ncbi:MAG TPA: TAT-variant-translocated molybdopterin oxidoreductase [Thermoanaerobaculia bacterium]|jgi:molybdopterin-containing oxidoreductase family iron-sulfur binding subunit|nr:TAT-variant-translocated molybdopterin oxidoreductase [Thermoanaerobaculia bacterium]
MDSAKGAKAKCAAEPSRPAQPLRLDLETVRRELRGKRGPDFWRSLDELAGTAEFQELLHREFPRQASEWIEPPAEAPRPPQDGAGAAGPLGTSRRAFLQLSSASLALAGLTACTRQPIEKIVPYVEQPEQVVPGRPLFFATTLTQGGFGVGVLAESHEGRPTKIEGNTEHPASLGSTDMFAQAAILELYDPARSQSVLHDGGAAMASTFLVAVAQLLRAKQATGGQGVRLLTGAVTSPTFAAQMKAFAALYPNARWHRWEPAGPLHSRAAAVRAFGRPVEARYDLSHADVIAAFDSDFLAAGPGSVPYARQFADRRRVREASPELPQKMNRLYAVETTPSPTGSIADHRLPLPPAELEALLLALARQVGVAGAPATAPIAAPAPAPAPAAPAPGGLSAKAQAFLEALAADLLAHPGASLVVAGETTSPAAQVLAHAINEKLGNAGKTVIYAEPAEIDPVDHLQSLAELVRDMRAGQVDLLIMLGGVNPVYTAPADLDFAAALAKVATRIHHGMYVDETAEYCHWHVPAAHDLECWGDARAFDGTASLAQPLIEPLYGGRSLQEVMAVLLGHGEALGYDLVRATWNGQLPGDFEAAWRKVLHDGVIPGTQLPPLGGVAVAGAAVAQAAGEIAAAAQSAPQRGLDINAATEEEVRRPLTLCFQPDPTIGDGSWASNVWLQELPKPMTKLTWDNAVLISPATHQRLGLDWEERVRVSVNGRKLDAAVWVLPGQADDTLTLSLGYGRRRAGENGSGLGFNAYVLRTAATPWSAPGAALEKLGERYIFACTQNHHAIDQEQGIDEDRLAGVEEEKRHILRTATLAEFLKDPDFVAHPPHGEEAPPRNMTLYPNRKYEGHSWGMAIDLNVCTGCSACVVACQAENNIPVVGKDQVMRRREMHWIRVDRYFTGDMDDPRLHVQPVPCMQCENAPCELVCPVGATVHSAEGLNDMTYNRCVGTRYCSNNCPYKVRRFNFLRYSDGKSPLAAMMYNPDVTVRMRGVMEKCTYCVQRIEHAKIDSQVSGQPIAEQRLKTACQQACPTQAIVFGDLNAEKHGAPVAEVSRWKASPLNYGMLDDLNTRPRTTYLARVTNPNPRLAPTAPAAPTAPTSEPEKRTT